MNGGLLVAGIGNVFLSDDGFGVEVVSRLADADLPAGVRLMDYGIRGMHLAYDLASYEQAILIDAAPRGESPGTVYVIEPDLSATPEADEAEEADGVGDAGAGPFFDAHGMQPDVVFSMLDQLTDQRPSRILVVGCEPATVEYGMGLSEPVASAVDEAVRVVLGLIAEQAERSEQAEPVASDSGPLLAEE
ncbi:MAG TPA: hydrogenase maturation protease [Streptosporangiaceae bacterium]|jgi:hydrogenase maturation protease|nr:hydrogenase maturation protease [Streptosporangiaceae bacterium]